MNTPMVYGDKIDGPELPSSDGASSVVDSRGDPPISPITPASAIPRYGPLLHPHPLDSFCPPSPLQTRTSRDWNAKYQEILSLSDSVEKFERLDKLASDFALSAKLYATIIVSEKHSDEKTIYQVNLGGVAGGLKYKVNSILFKFAEDFSGMYNGNEHAEKAASHDLKSLGHFSMASPPGIFHFPLACYIHYCGYALTAMSLLPINGMQTLKYGCLSAGDYNNRLVQANPTVHLKLKPVAESLNLREHTVESIKNSSAVSIYGPTDIEVHEGLDSRLYVIDLARLFPPEATEPKASHTPDASYLYNLLRPELVFAFQKPLNSDAFSPFATGDRLANEEVVECTNFLHKSVIPALAAELDSAAASSSPLHLENITNEFHSVGVNMRHLGNVRVLCKNPLASQLLLAEMIVRTLKNKMRKEWRRSLAENTHSGSSYSQENLKQIACNHLNLLLLPENSHSVVDFWTTEVKTLIEAKFGPNALKPDELSLVSSLTNVPRSFRTTVTGHLAVMMQHLVSLTGIELTTRAREFIRDPLAGVVISGATTAAGSPLPSVALGNTAMYEIGSQALRQVPLVVRPKLLSFGGRPPASANSALNRYDIAALHPIVKQTPISDFARLNALVLIGVNPETHQKEAERAFEVAFLTLQQSRHLSALDWTKLLQLAEMLIKNARRLIPSCPSLEPLCELLLEVVKRSNKGDSRIKALTADLRLLLRRQPKKQMLDHWRGDKPIRHFLDFKNAYVCFLLGKVLFLTGDTHGAKQCFHEALLLDPSFHKATIHLSNVRIAYFMADNRISATAVRSELAKEFSSMRPALQGDSLARRCFDPTPLVKSALFSSLLEWLIVSAPSELNMPIRLRNCSEVISLTIDKSCPITDQIAHNVFGVSDAIPRHSEAGLMASTHTIGGASPLRGVQAFTTPRSSNRLSVLDLTVKSLTSKLTATGLSHIITSSLSTLRELALFVSPTVFSKLLEPLKYCIHLQRLRVGGSVDWKDVEASVVHCKILSLHYCAKPDQGTGLFNELAQSWGRPMFRPFLSVHFSPGVHALFSTRSYLISNVGMETGNSPQKLFSNWSLSVQYSDDRSILTLTLIPPRILPFTSSGEDGMEFTSETPIICKIYFGKSEDEATETPVAVISTGAIMGCVVKANPAKKGSFFINYTRQEEEFQWKPASTDHTMMASRLVGQLRVAELTLENGSVFVKPQTQQFTANQAILVPLAYTLAYMFEEQDSSERPLPEPFVSSNSVRFPTMPQIGSPPPFNMPLVAETWAPGVTLGH